mmetsp:Transcript_11765/g.35715  ORF Transcript_11765/g.35715 Transcript_11765/m.35715 type:complete len:237 (-) Transcript_11765:586-1296(-)
MVILQGAQDVLEALIADGVLRQVEHTEAHLGVAEIRAQRTRHGLADTVVRQAHRHEVLVRHLDLVKDGQRRDHPLVALGQEPEARRVRPVLCLRGVHATELRKQRLRHELLAFLRGIPSFIVVRLRPSVIVFVEQIKLRMRPAAQSSLLRHLLPGLGSEIRQAVKLAHDARVLRPEVGVALGFRDAIHSLRGRRHPVQTLAEERPQQPALFSHAPRAAQRDAKARPLTHCLDAARL